MATRPSIAVTIRATDTNYSTGVVALQGTPTKISRAGSDITEGYKVDSPLGTQPVSAQETNFEDNRNDQWVNWVSEGSNSNTFSSNLVETDGTGDINVNGVNCINVRCTTNSVANGIEVTSSGGSIGLNLIQGAGATVPVFQVVGADAPGVPAANITSENADCLKVNVVEAGAALWSNHQTGPGVLIQGTTFGGVIGPSIRMDANFVAPNSLVAGTIWAQETGGLENLKAGMGTGGGASGGFVVLSKNSVCYGRSNLISNFNLTGTTSFTQIVVPWTWSDNMFPQEAALVRITIWGKLSLPSGDSSSAKLQVRDLNEASDPVIAEITIARDEDTGATVFDQSSATYATTYTLPAFGARSFDFGWEGTINGGSGTFSGFIEIQELRGD